jgi:SAM-dependent methyltransferase
MPDPRTDAVKKFVEQEPPGGLDVIVRYATDPPLAVQTLITAIREGLPDGGRVVELGFGSGWLLEELLDRLPRARLHALDMAPAFIADAASRFGTRVRLVRGDIERLPFAPASFDVITTNWTLYFMRDLAQALAGMRRCLRPGGRLVAATVAPDHMHEFETLVADCVRAVTGHEPEPDVGVRFNTERGVAPMRNAFDRVELREWGGELRLPDVPSAQALLSGWGPQQLAADERAALRDAFAERVATIIARDGEWRITRHDGAFVAWA